MKKCRGCACRAEGCGYVMSHLSGFSHAAGNELAVLLVDVVVDQINCGFVAGGDGDVLYCKSFSFKYFADFFYHKKKL